MTEYTYYDTLIDAARAALAQSEALIADDEIETASHLMAQRRLHADGSVAWFVLIYDSFDFPGATHLSDDPSEWSGSPETVAAYIESVWDADRAGLREGDVRLRIFSMLRRIDPHIAISAKRIVSLRKQKPKTPEA